MHAPAAQALDLTGTWSGTNNSTYEGVKCTFYLSAQKSSGTMQLGPIEISQIGNSIYADTTVGHYQGGSVEPFPNDDKSVAAVSACSASQDTVGAIFVRKAIDATPPKMVVELIGYRPVKRGRASPHLR